MTKRRTQGLPALPPDAKRHPIHKDTFARIRDKLAAAQNLRAQAQAAEQIAVEMAQNVADEAKLGPIAFLGLDHDDGPALLYRTVAPTKGAPIPEAVKRAAGAT